MKMISVDWIYQSIKMLTVIRHGEKTHDNGAAGVEYPDDPGLTVDGRKAAYDLGVKWREAGRPAPAYVVVSPYLRTRETAEAVLEGWIGGNWGNIPISIDVRISEAFGKRRPGSKKTQPSYQNMTPETAKFQPPLSENSSEVAARVQNFLSSQNPNVSVFVVTHGLVLTNFMRGIKYPEFLGGVEMWPNGKWRALS